MGLAFAPSTESIMGSLPRDKAGVGSAVNDTTREVGGTLGVAILGSLLSSLYGSHFQSAVPAGVPSRLSGAASESVGAALAVSEGLGATGGALASAAREAFVYAMSRALLVTAGIALVGALIAWRFLPAQATEAANATAIEGNGAPEAQPEVVAT